ncbi:hypothetical protein DYD21_06575 [Rhodohalobacter sp. SW132]|uniref:WD40/YVTN/BNR-like repeat-containing protein n=1 Tax=Rhodohalobacter sp. SW132 TaxID=2293433 RepID=UPI000E25AF38|nr:FlgD immunoglobulin-like domain containing protein [Rhodohalobacter sp. SW132]REL38266.1 hypothetical protein DYD21_06575 [Rhodohalobacter sp. SW132]
MAYLKWFLPFIVIMICSAGELYSQHFGPIPDRFESLRQNSITSLESTGNSLWIGPGLNRIDENSPDIFIPVNADSVFDGRGRVFSLQADGNRIVAGLGYNTESGDGSVQTGMGFYESIDFGESWRFIPFPLDPQPDENSDCTIASVGPPCDLEFTYGEETYIQTRITVPQQSPPFETDFRGETVFVAAWASGIQRSLDGGDTWERLILPPSSVSELTPDRSYQWTSQAGSSGTVERYDPRSDNNLLGFGLLIDSNDRVWAGTAAGINISENALTASRDQVSWRRISADGRTDGLLGNWIVNIREQPGTNRIWMSTWNATTSENDRFGLVYTEDGGETFRQFLEGERVNDIGFHNGTIFVAADRGLFISHDDGDTWRRIEQIRSPNQIINKDAEYFALTATEDRIWVGTSDGLASSSDGGETWAITRVDFPLSGGNIYQQDASDVDTFAYPNPFSPDVHNMVRIKYETSGSGRSTLRIFDFAMNQVYEQRTDGISQSGSYEFTWNGTDSSGRYVATGSYIYVIETPGGQVDGKILLID